MYGRYVFVYGRYVYECVYVCYIYVYIHTYVYTYIHIKHTHTHKLTHVPLHMYILFFFFSGTQLLPESARWLALRGRADEAVESVMRLEGAAGTRESAELQVYIHTLHSYIHPQMFIRVCVYI